MSTKCRIILFFIGGIIIVSLGIIMSLICHYGGVFQPYFHLKGDERITISYQKKYEEIGFIARKMFKNENDQVMIKYQNQQHDRYDITYTYQDKTYVRHVQIVDDQAPKLDLNGSQNIVLFENESYQEEGAKAYDEIDGQLDQAIQITSNIQNKIGTYQVKYEVSDHSGNKTSLIRKVQIVKDPTLKKLYYQHDAYDNTYEEWWFEKSKKQLQNKGARSKNFLNQYHAYYQGKNEKVIYLTFDEGGNDETYIKEIADILDKHKIKASFFLTANYLRAEADWVKQMVKNGHDILNHTSHHKEMPKLAHQSRVDEFVSEIMAWEKDYYRIIGKSSKPFFRFPKGGFSERSLKMVADLGYHTIFWSHAFYDYGETISKEDAFKAMMDHYHPGAIYLLHPSNKGNYEAIEDFLLEMKQKGYRFALLDELKET